MTLSSNAIAAAELVRLVGSAKAPLLFDVRRRAVFDKSERMIAGARWRDHASARDWAAELPAGADIVVYCAHGHNVGQTACTLLQAEGRQVRYLDGGFEAFVAAGGATIARASRPDCDRTPSRWVTRERPKVDRIACPWLIRRFVDPAAEIHYVAPDYLLDIAKEMNATPFDVEGVDYAHDGEFCSFDTFIRRLDVRAPELDRLARIVRGADTARPDLEPQCAGLLALALGVSAMESNDHQALEIGMRIYDALYAWARHARSESHNWPASATTEPRRAA